MLQGRHVAWLSALRRVSQAALCFVAGVSSVARLGWPLFPTVLRFNPTFGLHRSHLLGTTHSVMIKTVYSPPLCNNNSDYRRCILYRGCFPLAAFHN